MTKELLNKIMLDIITELDGVNGIKAVTCIEYNIHCTEYNLQVISDDNEFGNLDDWLEDFFNDETFKKLYPNISVYDIFDFDSYHNSNIGDFEDINLQTIEYRFDEVTD